jgi:hypothetical protein
MGLFGSDSKTVQTTTTTTSTWNNSGNTALTASRVFDNVGNPVLNIGLPGAGADGGTERLITLGLGVILILFGMRALLRSG